MLFPTPPLFYSSIPPFDELDTVTVGVFDEEDAGAAAHRVGFALEVDAAGFFQFVRQRVEVFDGEGDVTVAFTERVRLAPVVVEGEFQAGFGVAGDGEEGVGGVVSDGDLPREFETELVGIEVDAPVEIQDPVTGVYVLHPLLLFVAGQLFSLRGIVAKPRISFADG